MVFVEYKKKEIITKNNLYLTLASFFFFTCRDVNEQWMSYIND